MPLSISDQ